MSKLKKIKVQLKEGDFFQIQFFYSWMIFNPNRRISASYSMVFRLNKLQKNFKEPAGATLGFFSSSSEELGAFFVENVLVEHILPLHPSSVIYSRIQFQVPRTNSRPNMKFNYEISSLRGTAKSDYQGDSAITGNYSSRFSNEDQMSALSLRIRNVCSRPKLDYFIDDLATSLKLFKDAELGKVEATFVLAGLTLNRTYESLYNSFDTILEKIS